MVTVKTVNTLQKTCRKLNHDEVWVEGDWLRLDDDDYVFLQWNVEAD